MEAIKCPNCEALTPAGYQAQSVLIDRVRAQVLAFDKEFGDHRKGIADATNDFFAALEKFGDEASHLQLDELRKHLATAGPRKKADSQTEDPAEFESDQHSVVADAIRRLDLVSRRLPGTSLPALQQEFYERVLAALTQIKDLNSDSEAGPRTKLAKVELDQFRQTMHNLIWEGHALGVSAQLLHSLGSIPDSRMLDFMLRHLPPINCSKCVAPCFREND